MFVGVVVQIKRYFILSIFFMVLVSCRTTSVSQVANSNIASTSDRPKKTLTFEGKSGEARCGLRLEWDIFGITELKLTGTDFRKFELESSNQREFEFIDHTKRFSLWLRNSSYGLDQQAKGFLPEYRLAIKPHFFTRGLTYDFKAGWYLNEPGGSAPASKVILVQTLELNGSIDAQQDEIKPSSYRLEQTINEHIPLPLGHSEFVCEELRNVRD